MKELYFTTKFDAAMFLSGLFLSWAIIVTAETIAIIDPTIPPLAKAIAGFFIFFYTLGVAVMIACMRVKAQVTHDP